MICYCKYCQPACFWHIKFILVIVLFLVHLIKCNFFFSFLKNKSKHQSLFYCLFTRCEKMYSFLHGLLVQINTLGKLEKWRFELTKMDTAWQHHIRMVGGAIQCVKYKRHLNGTLKKKKRARKPCNWGATDTKSWKRNKRKHA